MSRIAIFGAGHLGMQLAHHLQQAGHTLAGFYDDTLPRNISVLNDLRNLGGKLDLLKDHTIKYDSVLIGVGYNHMTARKRLYEEFKSHDLKFHTFIHASVHVDATAKIGEGAVIYPGCIIDMHCRIEANVLLNNGVIVSHDSCIGAHSFVAPGVNFAGFVSVGECNFVGIGSTLKDGIKTCNNVVIGAGSLILKDLNVPGLYHGTPAILK